MTKTIFGLLIFFALLATGVGAKPKSDPRLATMRVVFIEAKDTLGDDVAVAACLPEKLAAGSPLTIAPTRESADAILTIAATMNAMATAKDGFRAGFFMRNHADIKVTAQDGTELWSDRVPLGVFQRDGACKMAEGLVKRLRDAMRKARDAK